MKISQLADVQKGVVCRISALGENLVQAAGPASGARRAAGNV